VTTPSANLQQCWWPAPHAGDLATAHPPGSGYAMRYARKIAAEPSVIIVEEVALQLTVNGRHMPSNLHGDLANGSSRVPQTKDQLTFVEIKLMVSTWHPVSFREERSKSQKSSKFALPNRIHPLGYDRLIIYIMLNMIMRFGHRSPLKHAWPISRWKAISKCVDGSGARLASRRSITQHARLGLCRGTWVRQVHTRGYRSHAA